MSHLGFEICGQIDNVDGAKGALFDTNTTSYAETFRDEGDFGLGCHFDTQLAGSYNRA